MTGSVRRPAETPIVGSSAAERSAAGVRRAAGLRIDVDTHDGMRDGVPSLLESLGRTGTKGSFFFSMGPDRSGRAVFQLLRPGFATKMARTGAPRLYGWRTLLSGTLLPSRPIGAAFPDLILRCRAEGHEIGVHAWDHRTWQDGVERFRPGRAARELDRARTAFEEAAGETARGFAAPAWITVDEALLHQETFGLDFASDCRGREPFLPVIGERRLSTPQVPSTLPTLDEALGLTHATAESFFSDLVDLSLEQPWPVVTVHSEGEGSVHAGPFRGFLEEARSRGLELVPLGELLRRRREAGELEADRIVLRAVAGRHGRLACQESSSREGVPSP